MAQRQQDDLSRYVTDIVNLSVALDEATTLANSQPIARTLRKAKEDYFELVYRRVLLDFSVGDAPAVLWMLDLIQAQLAALARLQHETSLPPVVPDGARTAVSALDGQGPG
ncbi:MAG TPA: hypothetical protein VJS11_15225 [Acidobacteriaceae bacterium]|nr:hypothetical protein [Acidobacteriaceae bacterium]